MPEPLQSSTRTATRATAFATPHVVPPTVPATCVPCPWQSSAAPPSTASKPLLARPPKSSCVTRIPVSITYALTPAPVASYVYVPSSGSSRWSIRSSPHVAFVCVSTAHARWSRSTYATFGLRRTASTAAGDSVAANPFSACSYV